ncbi:hypothetical protein AGLY_009912, partial [Aphis glycines]
MDETDRAINKFDFIDIGTSRPMDYDIKMKPQEIKKKYFIEVENKRYKCVFCKQTYKENVTRMVLHFQSCKKVPSSINKTTPNQLDTYFLQHQNDSSLNSTSAIKNIQDQNSNLKQGNITSFMDGMNSNEQSTNNLKDYLTINEFLYIEKISMANIHSIAEISKNATVVENDLGRQISNTGYCSPGSSRDTESRLEQETNKSACIPSNFQKIYITSNNKKNWKVTVHGINNTVFNEMQQSMRCNGIHASLYKNVYKLNYQRTTVIQEYAMPIIMNGKDIIARTQNGSGKTTAIAISILDNLLKNVSKINVDSHRSDPLAVIVVPTKQRVQHIYNVIHRLSKNNSIKCGPLFNKSLSDQKNEIQ